MYFLKIILAVFFSIKTGESLCVPHPLNGTNVTFGDPNPQKWLHLWTAYIWNEVLVVNYIGKLQVRHLSSKSTQFLLKEGLGVVELFQFYVIHLYFKNLVAENLCIRISTFKSSWTFDFLCFIKILDLSKNFSTVW